MGFKIIWSPTARSDLRDIVCYIARDNPRRAEQFGFELMAQAEKMENFPDLGRQVPEQHDPQIREIIYGRYRIIYRVRREPGAIEIITVWHGARGTPPVR